MKYTPIRQRVIEMLQQYEKSSEEWVGGRVNVKVDDHVDIIATLRALESDDAKTIIVPAEQALALLPAAKRFEEHLDFHLPFECCVFQFDQPIPEEKMLHREREEADEVMALVVVQYEGVNSATAWFKSTAVNRVAWDNAPTSDFRFSPTAFEIMEDESDVLLGVSLTPAEVKMRNKETLRLLACAIVAYINCENVTIEKGEDVPEKVNRKREKEGKRRIDPYYVVKIRHEKVESGGGTGTGTKHSFRYDVRGHFRRMADGKLTWVRAHQRGLSHEFYVPNVYKV